jgi:hypothetical protein
MTTSTAIIQNLASPEFSGGLYESMSVLSKLAKFVTQRANVMRMAAGLRKTNVTIKSLLDLVDDSVTGKRQLVERETTPEEIQRIADNLDYLIRTIDYLYESMRRAGLTNNSLVAGQLATLHSTVEPLKDIADWADLMAKPKELDAILARARKEKERGEVYDLRRGE